MHSTLEDIPGIGATRRRALLTHFKSVANIADGRAGGALRGRRASARRRRKAIWDYYHPE